MSKVIITLMWIISPLYFTFVFFKYMFIDFCESLVHHSYDKYISSYKQLYKHTKMIYNGEIDYMGNSLKDNDTKEEDIYKE